MLELKPFRLLDLPKELRFIIYENLTISTKQLRLLPVKDSFQVDRETIGSSDDQPAITITLQTLPVQIFSTCHLIHSEALPILARKLDKIRETLPRITIDADCLYTQALHNTQNLLSAVLDNLNTHPFFTPALTKPISPALHPPLCTHEIEPQEIKPQGIKPQYSPQIQQWLAQTTLLLLSQRPPPCPFAGFMGARTYPTVRLILEVPKLWKYTTYRGLAVESGSTPTLYTGSVTSQLSQLYSELVEYTRELRHVKSGAIVFGQGDERVLLKRGLVVRKTVALDFGICRVGE